LVYAYRVSATDSFGFGVPLITPTNERGQVDFPATRRLWEYLFPLVDVPVVLGTTGRGRFILNEEPSEAKRLVDLGVELSRQHRKPLVVGAGAETVERARELTAYAAERGVYAVLVTAPIFSSSPFAKSLAASPLSAEYQDRLCKEYFFTVMDSIPSGSSTIFMPYIFPTLTDADPRTFLRPTILSRLHERAAATGRKLDGGKLTLRDDTVALDYAERCPELSFLAGMDSTVQVFLGNPRLHFSGAILGSGNLIPKFLHAHVRDCIRLRGLLQNDPSSTEVPRLTRATLSSQHQVSALFNDLWDSGLFGALIHGFLGAGSPYRGPKVAAGELSAWARSIAANAPGLVSEIAAYCPESPLSIAARAVRTEGLGAARG
jgi:dihydrodipicolinate synthase/N-acetylneuraminate lyase